MFQKGEAATAKEGRKLFEDRPQDRVNYESQCIDGVWRIAVAITPRTVGANRRKHSRALVVN
eukprot:445586-Alexandrium_andersonii.AAC.1